MPAPATKYTDRDVRENPDLYDVVIDYLNRYEGEFDFLIDCKMRLAQRGQSLTVGMIRGVLNCMRVDPRVQDLPEPIGYEDEENVIQMTLYEPGRRRRTRASLPAVVPEVCPQDGTEHDMHWFSVKRGGKQHCLGWHAVNRDITHTRARFHADYLRGRSSNLIHRSTHEGELSWFPHDFHAEGEAYIAFWWVKSVCPLRLKNPHLLTADQVKEQKPYDAPTYSKKYETITFCSRCFPVANQT